MVGASESVPRNGGISVYAGPVLLGLTLDSVESTPG